jgi:hypothetical protein
LKLATREIAGTSEIIAGHMRPTIFTARQISRRAIHRLHAKFKKNVIGLLLLFLADLGASRGPARRPEAYAHAWNQVMRGLAIYLEAEAKPLQPLVNGRDLMSNLSTSPGPHLGRLLRKLLELQAAGEISTRDEALEAARRLLEKH